MQRFKTSILPELFSNDAFSRAKLYLLRDKDYLSHLRIQLLFGLYGTCYLSPIIINIIEGKVEN